MFVKVSLGIITVAALLFIGTCVVVIAALNDVSDEVADSRSDEEVFIQISGAPGTTCAVDRLEGFGESVPGILTSCTVPGRIVLAPPNTYFGSRLTATIRQTSKGSLSLKVTGCGGKLTSGKTDTAEDTVTVGCD